MTREEKKKKAIAVAIAYFLEQEKEAKLPVKFYEDCGWVKVHKKIKMKKRMVIQRRGRLLRNEF